MINILVTIEVKDFNLFATFERKALEIMRSHGGDIIRAFETHRNDDGSGQEIHLLEFPNDRDFSDYRANPLLLVHSDLREKAIKSTSVVTSIELKNYI